MKLIPLTNGLFAKVDDEDFEWLSGFRWHSARGYSTIYAKRKLNRRAIWMHRYILGMNDPTLIVDHIDGNGLNNQRSNLRIATKQQNNLNSRVRKDCVSGFKGVHWNKGSRAWLVHVSINGTMKQVGQFNCPIEAAKFYDRLAVEIHGEFGKTNKSLGLI